MADGAHRHKDLTGKKWITAPGGTEAVHSHAQQFTAAEVAGLKAMLAASGSTGGGIAGGTGSGGSPGGGTGGTGTGGTPPPPPPATLTPSGPLHLTPADNNAVIENLDFGTGDGTGQAIWLEGTASGHMQNITIRNCRGARFNNFLDAYYVDGLSVELDEPSAIRDMTYGGLVIRSCVGAANGNAGLIKGVPGQVVVDRVGSQLNVPELGTDWNDAYGLTFTHDWHGTASANPRSHGFTVEDFLVRDVHQAQGFNSHSGYDLTFTRCQAINCRRGFFFAPFAPLRMTGLVFDHCDALLPNASVVADAGFFIAGADGPQYLNCSMSSRYDYPNPYSGVKSYTDSGTGAPSTGIVVTPAIVRV